MLRSSHFFVFWYFGHFSCMIFFPVFSVLPILQNVKKKIYVIFSYFRNFVAKSDQKPKTKNGMNKTIASELPVKNEIFVLAGPKLKPSFLDVIIFFINNFTRNYQIFPCPAHQKVISNELQTVRCQTSISHGLLYIWTELLSIFFS